MLRHSLAICAQAAYTRLMSIGPTTLERAFQIAGSTRCRSMEQLRLQLVREGFHDHVRALFGVAMREQLQALMTRRPSASPTGAAAAEL